MNFSLNPAKIYYSDCVVSMLNNEPCEVCDFSDEDLCGGVNFSQDNNSCEICTSLSINGSLVTAHSFVYVQVRR